LSDYKHKTGDIITPQPVKYIFRGILDEEKQIENSPELRQQWEKYRREFDYASDISYEQVVDVLKAVSMKLLG